MTQNLLIRREGPVARVHLNRPEQRNAFNGDTILELLETFDTLSNDDETRVIVLGGEGKSFCAGADLGWMRALAMSGDNREGARTMARLFGQIDACRKPVIARIHGATIGGGMGILSGCDIVIAVEGAKFSFSEVRLGLAPAVISPFVIRRIGRRVARQIFVTGERFAAPRAYELGLVDRVVADEAALDAAVDETIHQILLGAPEASIACKELARTVGDLDPEAAFDFTADLIARLRASPEGQEGMMAFLQRRSPSWAPSTDKEG